jgi:hypothetical protein
MDLKRQVLCHLFILVYNVIIQQAIKMYIHENDRLHNNLFNN